MNVWFVVNNISFILLARIIFFVSTLNIKKRKLVCRDIKRWKQPFSFKKAPKGFLTSRDLGANIVRALKVSICIANMAARYDRTIVIWKGALKKFLAVFMWWNLGFPATAPVIFIRPLKRRSTEKKTSWDRLPQGDRSRQIRKFTHTQIQILARFYSITWCFTTKKIGISRARFIAFPSVEFPMICWTVKHICALLVPVDNKNS